MRSVIVFLLLTVAAAAQAQTQPLICQAWSDGTKTYELCFSETEAASYTLRALTVKSGSSSTQVDSVASLFPEGYFEAILSTRLWNTFFFVEDLNFDGYNDIRTQQPDGDSNVPFYCWLFDPSTGKFVRSRAFELLHHPVFNAAKKEILTYAGISDSCTITHYRCVNNQPVLTKTETVPGYVFYLDSVALVFSYNIGGCTDDRYFTSTDHRHYFLEGTEAPWAGTAITVLPLFSYEKIEVKSRLATAYGIRVSETEGVIFYDSTLRYTDSGELRATQGSSWYAFERAHALQQKGDATFYEGNSNKEWKFAASPKPGDARKADAFLRAHYASLYDTNFGAADEPYIKDELPFHRTQLYYYLEELEIAIHTPKGVIRKTLALRVRHGEC